MQAFLGLLVNAAIAGLLSPLLATDGRTLALGAAVFTALGWLFWWWEIRASRRILRVPDKPVSLEPTEL